MKALVTLIIAVLAIVALASRFIVGAAAWPWNITTPAPRHVVVLIDDTASFHPYFDEARRKLQELARTLSGGDRLTVVSITDRAVTRDVRLDLTLPVGYVRCMQAKAELSKELEAFQPEPTSSGAMLPNGRLKGRPWGTALAGALGLGASVCSPSDHVNLVVFSDFEDSPTNTKSAAGLTYPAGTRFHGLYAATSANLAEYETRLTAWSQVLQTMGVSATKADFMMPQVATAASPRQILL